VTRTPPALAIVAIAALVFLPSCGGDGGSGGGGRLVLITADGATGELWALVGGVPSVPPVCPGAVFVNARITFTFDGPVDEASIPGGPLALGSLNVVTTPGGIPAEGTFDVEDDPAFPAGNRRRVVFSPALPGNPSSPCAGGLGGSQSWQITVPSGGSQNVVVVGGEPIQAGAVTCFATCDCPGGGVCASRFTDVVAGPPFVVDTTPATADPAPPAVDRCTVAQNTIQIRVSEPLDPSGISPANVRVVNVATGGQVPGFVVFHQATSFDGMARIDYVAADTLPPAATFQVLLAAGVTDFGGNPVEPAQGNPAAQLFFQTAPAATLPQPPLVELFDTPNPGGTTGAAAWAGDGALRATLPLDLVGTGAEGAFTAPPAMMTIFDTNQMMGGQSRKGVWNFTDVNIPATATVRFVGPYQAHIRCTGSFTLDGTINANAGMLAWVSPNPWDQGPEPGWPDAGSGGPNSNIWCVALGGKTSASGGVGGSGSNVTPWSGPFVTCPLRTLKGENGYGPFLDGLPNDGSSSNPFYAGGQGGDSGCLLVPSGPDCMPGDLGGLGGAGGTAGRIGEAGIPRISTAACTPTPGVVQPIAQPSPVPPVMIPPIGVQSAGSGGGGGGDDIENTGTIPFNDDEGAGGGGAGGGVRISCLGPYAQGASGVITARGAFGAYAQGGGGGGGSGSGGEVWIQTFSTLFVSATATIDVTGPGRFAPSVGSIGCSNQAAGGGGPGLVQLEAGQGATPTPNFNLLPAPTPTTGAVFSAPPFAFAGAITGQGRSGLRYAGAPAPDYMGAVEVFSLGNAAGATLTIRYEGAFEAVSSTPGNPIPDPATVKSMATGGGPITAANLDELDGYPFIEFVVEFSYAAPPATPPTATLPSVDSITIAFNAPAPCP
jgi:hypothetical protein